MSELTSLLANYWHLAIVGLLLIWVSGVFVLRFVKPARHLSKELARAAVALRAIKAGAGSNFVELNEIATQAMGGRVLAHLWSEYTETLHPQREDDELGQSRIRRWRSTSLAETFFTEQAVVDTPLQTEFHKHLPGILTGLGIIGTFTGLIIGLRHFRVSSVAAESQAELTKLVHAVGDAFFVSATAIGLAMLFTWIEKWVVASCYRQVEELREIIDSLFKAGAGEEYLERLVLAAETSATQSAQIKDSLVSDLRLILNEVTTRQIEAQSLHTGQISGDVGKAVSESLSGPMAAISEAVRGASANQGEAVNKLLTDVLASFSAQMREIFGGQMEGMADSLKQTSEAMKDTAAEFRQVAAGMKETGAKTVDAMGDRLNIAFEAMEARQHTMNTQMGAFVEQIRSLVSESQSESSRKLQEVLGSVGEQVAGVVAELSRQAEASAESQGHRQERFERSTGEAIGSLSAYMEGLLRQSVETNQALQSTVASLASATDKAISGMNSGAEMLYIASSDFAKAGQGVSETMRLSSAAVETIKTASVQLTLATAGTKGILEDYGRTRSSFAVMVSELNVTLDNAKRDAFMTSELIDRIEAATTQLSRAQKQSEEYLAGVSTVLVKAHEAFAQSVERTLREGNRQFQGELSTAIGYLSGAIKSLADVVDDIQPRK